MIYNYIKLQPLLSDFAALAATFLQPWAVLAKRWLPMFFCAPGQRILTQKKNYRIPGWPATFEPAFC